MKSIAAGPRVKVSADGHGVLSHAGMGMLRELADLTGLVSAGHAPLWRTLIAARGCMRPGMCSPIWPPRSLTGRTALTGSGSCVGIASMSSARRPRPPRCGGWSMSASTRRTCRGCGRLGRRPERRRGRPEPPRHRGDGCTSISTPRWSSTIPTTRQSAAPTWKKTFGHHPLLAFLDRPEIAGGEPLAGLLRAGNAGSNTAADHITVLDHALESLPAGWRPSPGNPGAAQVLVRCDSAGATHGFAEACRAAGVGFSFGHPVDAHVQDAADTLNRAHGWYPAIDTDGEIRDGAWVAEATTLVDLSSLAGRDPVDPAQRATAPGCAAAVHRRRRDARNRVHHRHRARRRRRAARRTRAAAPPARPRRGPHPRTQDQPGWRNLPCQSFDANSAWLEIILAATDLVAWAQLIGFTEHAGLARCEITTFRYRVLHVAARITRGARQVRLRLDTTWRWATPIATAWQRIRTAFG